jgi:hypothetical protein
MTPGPRASRVPLSLRPGRAVRAVSVDSRMNCSPTSRTCHSAGMQSMTDQPERTPLRAGALVADHTAPLQFMNQDYVGTTAGRCGDVGYGKNELKFSAYVKQANPFQPASDPQPVVDLGE